MKICEALEAELVQAIGRVGGLLPPRGETENHNSCLAFPF